MVSNANSYSIFVYSMRSSSSADRRDSVGSFENPLRGRKFSPHLEAGEVDPETNYRSQPKVKNFESHLWHMYLWA